MKAGRVITQRLRAAGLFGLSEDAIPVYVYWRLECVSFIHQNKELPKPVHEIYGAFVAVDENASRGTSYLGEAVLMICTHVMRAKIEEHLAKCTLNVDSLADRLGGKEGFGDFVVALADWYYQTLPR